MNTKKKRKASKEFTLDLGPMIDVTFLLIIYFIVSMQMEPSLDSIIKLPPILNAAKQEEALLQIYVLPAKIMPGGGINPDSTGLIAFSDKSKAPDVCPQCSANFKTSDGLYIKGSLKTLEGVPLSDLTLAMAEAFDAGGAPPALNCSNCGQEISPFLKLEDIPQVLKVKKKEVLAQMLRQKNNERNSQGKPPMSPVEEKEFAKTIPLMIKADSRAFYGRILQVVNMAKDTASDIQSFAFITAADASKAAIEQKANREKGNK